VGKLWGGFKKISSSFLCRRRYTKFAPANGTKKPPNTGPIIPEILSCKPLKAAADGSSRSETNWGNRRPGRRVESETNANQKYAGQDGVRIEKMQPTKHR
jgi:hypothetical protein